MSNYKPPMMSIMNCHHIQSILTVSSGNGIEAPREDYTYCGEETWEENNNKGQEVKGWTEIWQ